jgi:protein phosphatase
VVRSGNEDSYFASSDAHAGVFIVADGMGGHAAGEVASEMAVRTIAADLRKVFALEWNSIPEVLAEALRHANRTIHDRTLVETDKQGMGTTASVLLLGRGRYAIGQIGDSRVYMLRNGSLMQITKDHSYVQEQVDAGLLTLEQARYHPYSNVITRCVGAAEEVEPDLYEGAVEAGDLFLVASDGLTGMVDDRRLEQLLLSRATPDRLVAALIAEANGRGGLDNITSIVVQVDSVAAEDTEPSRPPAPSDRTRQ